MITAILCWLGVIEHAYEYGRAVIDGEDRTIRWCTRCGKRSAHSGDRTEPFDYWYRV
jgi:hypothetical protein